MGNSGNGNANSYNLEGKCTQIKIGERKTTKQKIGGNLFFWLEYFAYHPKREQVKNRGKG
jgi:hypothetical protein